MTGDRLTLMVNGGRARTCFAFPLGALALFLLALLLTAVPAQAKPVLERTLGAPRLSNAESLTVDADDNVYALADQQVIKYRSDGTFLARFGREQSLQPRDIAVGPSGAIYVLDRYRVVKLDANGEFLAEWGGYGSGDGQLDWPSGIAVDADENVYVADTNNHRVVKFDANGELLAQWGGQGSGDGELQSPRGVAVDADDNVYVADTQNHRIQVFDPQGNFLLKWGSEGSGEGQFRAPERLATDSEGYVYVADANNWRVQIFDHEGGFTAMWGAYEFGYATGIDVDSAGFVYIANTATATVQKLDSEGNVQQEWGSKTFEIPEKAVRDSGGNTYVVDSYRSQVAKLDAEGRVVLTIGQWGWLPGELDEPKGLDVDEDAALLYVADTQNHRIQVFDAADGSYVDHWGRSGSGDGEFSEPSDIALAPDGTVYVADYGNQRIQRFSADGEFLGKWGSSGEGPGQFNGPGRVYIGADGSVYVADEHNGRVQRFSATGEHLGTWSGSDDRITGVAVRDDGLIYVANLNNRRIQIFDPEEGLIGQWGNQGWGREHFSSIAALAFTPQGELLVTDRHLFEVKQYRFTAPQVAIDEAPADPGNEPRPTFAFSSDDETASFECSLVAAGDDAEFGECSGPNGTHTPAEPLADGRYTFSVRARDGFGDATAEPPTHSFTIDATPPVTTITAAPPQRSNDPNPVFEFEADKEGATFECKLDQGGWEECSSPASYEALADGEHVFTVRATDPIGNREADPPAHTFAIDTVAPKTQITAGPSGPTNQTRPRFEFEADKQGVSFECSLVPADDDAEFGPCSEGAAHEPADDLQDGEYVFRVRATDDVGNREAEPPVREFAIDTVAPTTTITKAPRELSNDPDPVFEFEADKPGVEFECRLDDSGWQSCESPKAYEDLGDGEHTFRVRATDAAGNTEIDPPTHEFVLDTVAPKTTITAAPPQLSNDPNPRFEFEADKEGATFQCKLDQGEWEECASPKDYEGLADGEHVFRVRATDRAGNTDANPPARAFAIDTVAPTTTITNAPPKRSNDPNPVFEFEADKENVSFECRLDEGWEPCESPKAYTGLDDGDYLFRVRATDAAGNRETDPPARELTIDTEVPVITIEAGPKDGERVRAKRVRFEFSAHKPGVSFECKLDQGEWEPCSSPHVLRDLGDDEHTFAIRATDEAGNSAELARSFTVVAASCKAAEGRLAKAKQRAKKAQAKLKKAKRKLRKLKRRGAARAKVKRAGAKVKQARKLKRAAQKGLKRARVERRRAC